MEALAFFIGAGTEGKRKFSIHDFAHALRGTFRLIEQRLSKLTDEEDAIRVDLHP